MSKEMGEYCDNNAFESSDQDSDESEVEMDDFLSDDDEETVVKMVYPNVSLGDLEQFSQPLVSQDVDSSQSLYGSPVLSIIDETSRFIQDSQLLNFNMISQNFIFIDESTQNEQKEPARRSRGSRGRSTRRTENSHPSTAPTQERIMDWSKTEFSIENLSFEDSECGPTFKLAQLCPLDCFLEFFKEDVIERIVQETNTYSNQQSFLGESTNTNISEIKALIGIMIVMSLVKMKSIDDYFSQDSIFDFPFVKNIISRDRLRLLISSLHCNDNTKKKNKGEIGYDPLFKVRPLVDELNKNFKKNWKPFRNVVVDEGMISCKSPKSRFRIYMPAKPVKWGYKVWKIVD